MPALSDVLDEVKGRVLSGQTLPCFEPPYGSPIEQLFAWSMLKYVRDDCKVDTQVRAKTICGNFYLDFVVTAPSGFRVAYECDGKEFHDRKRDMWRDSLILGAGAVDAICRIRGGDINYRINDVLFLLSRWDLCVFTERGRRNLRTLASDRAIWCHENSQCSTDAVVRIGQYYLNISRRNRNGDEYWRNLFEFAKSMGGGKLDAVMKKYHR